MSKVIEIMRCHNRYRTICKSIELCPYKRPDSEDVPLFGIHPDCPLPDKQSDAVEFGRWISDNKYDNYGFNIWSKPEIIEAFTTEQLYEQFKQQP